jgi:hypothetical protein
MAEIIGEHMMPVFERIGIFPKNTYRGSIGYWSNFEVWELTDNELQYLIKHAGEHISDKEWNEIAPKGAWWRYAEGSNQGTPNEEFIINDLPLLAWRSESQVDYLTLMWVELPYEERAEYKDFEDYLDVWLPKYYNNILEYFSEEIGASTEKNICALVTDIAKYNNMSIADVFKIYG